MKNKKCLIEGCENNMDVYSCRGLCHYHYSMVRKLVKEKKRTWEEFEKVGMSLKIKQNKKICQKKKSYKTDKMKS